MDINDFWKPMNNAPIGVRVLLSDGVNVAIGHMGPDGTWIQDGHEIQDMGTGVLNVELGDHVMWRHIPALPPMVSSKELPSGMIWTPIN